MNSIQSIYTATENTAARGAKLLKKSLTYMICTVFLTLDNCK